MMCVLVHGWPQLTGHPWELYVCKRGAAGCKFANARGHIRPILPMSERTVDVSGNGDFGWAVCVRVDGVIAAWMSVRKVDGVCC